MSVESANLGAYKYVNSRLYCNESLLTCYENMDEDSPAPISKAESQPINFFDPPEKIIVSSKLKESMVLGDDALFPLNYKSSLFVLHQYQLWYKQWRLFMAKPVSTPLSPTHNQDNDSIKLTCGWNKSNMLPNNNKLFVGVVDLLFKGSENQFRINIPENLEKPEGLNHIRFNVKKGEKETNPTFLSVTIDKLHSMTLKNQVFEINTNKTKPSDFPCESVVDFIPKDIKVGGEYCLVLSLNGMKLRGNVIHEGEIKVISYLAKGVIDKLFDQVWIFTLWLGYNREYAYSHPIAQEEIMSQCRFAIGDEVSKIELPKLTNLVRQIESLEKAHTSDETSQIKLCIETIKLDAIGKMIESICDKWYSGKVTNEQLAEIRILSQKYQRDLIASLRSV